MAKFKDFQQASGGGFPDYAGSSDNYSFWKIANHTDDYVTAFDKVGFTPYSLELAITFDLVMTSVNPDDRLADLDCDHEQWVYDLYDTVELFQARNLSPLLAHLDCDYDQSVYDQYDTVELFTGSFADTNLTGNIDCTFENWAMIAQTGLHMDCSFQPWSFYAYYNIEGEDMDSCSFRAFECEMYGDSTYVSMDVEFKPFDCRKYTGAHFSLVFQDLVMDNYGVTGYTGTIDCVMRRFEFLADGGLPSYMDMTFEAFGFEATAQTEILAGLDLIFRMPTIASSGDSDIVGGMDLRFTPFRIQINAVGYAEPVGALAATFTPFSMSMAGYKGIDGDIAANAITFGIEMTGYSDGPNSLDLVFEEFDVGSSDDGGEGGADCALADTLTYTR